MKSIFPEDVGDPGRLVLTIHLGRESCSFSLCNPEKSGSFFYSVLTGENLSDPFSVFKEAFFENDFFSLPFGKVWIIYHTPFFTYIPDSIFQDKTKDDYLAFLFSRKQGMTLSHLVSNTTINVSYHIPESVYEFFIRSFTEPKFIHYSAPMITYFTETVKKANSRQMFVNLREKGLDIFCFSGETFLLGNYFPCNNYREAVYYILLIWKQLQFNQLNDILHFAGHTVFKEELINNLSSYLSNIQCLTVSSDIFPEGIETGLIPFELTAFSSCVL